MTEAKCQAVNAAAGRLGRTAGHAGVPAQRPYPAFAAVLTLGDRLALRSRSREGLPPWGCCKGTRTT